MWQSNEQGKLEAELFPLRIQLNKGGAEVSHASYTFRCTTDLPSAPCGLLKHNHLLTSSSWSYMAAKAETAKKAQQLEKLQDLCRSLQLQNRHIKEEDVRKRKDMLDTFNDSIKDIKSKCAPTPSRILYKGSVDAGLLVISARGERALRM